MGAEEASGLHQNGGNLQLGNATQVVDQKCYLLGLVERRQQLGEHTLEQFGQFLLFFGGDAGFAVDTDTEFHVSAIEGEGLFTAGYMASGEGDGD